MVDREFTLPITELSPKKTSPITPDFLKPITTLEIYYDKLYESPQWKNSANKDYKPNNKHHTFSLSLKQIPQVLHLMEIIFEGAEEPLETTETSPKPLSKNAVLKKSLKEAATLFDLWRFIKRSEKDIESCFPTKKRKQIAPYFRAISKATDPVEAWETFYSDKDLAENEEELEIRRDRKNLQNGYLLCESLFKNPIVPIRNYHQISVALNIGKLSETGNRIQLTGGIDRLLVLNDRVKYDFSNLVFDENKSYAKKFQALTLAFSMSHFVNLHMGGKELKKNKGAFFNKAIKNLIPQPSNHQVHNNYFDLDLRKITPIPICIDYQSPSGKLYLDWLNFISNFSVVFKKETKYFLENKKFPPVEYIQTPLIYYHGHQTYVDLSNIPPAERKPEAKNNIPTYTYGVSEAAEKCPTCAIPMTQICDRVTDLGGPNISFWVQLYCEGHHHEARRMKNVQRMILEYQNQSSNQK